MWAILLHTRRRWRACRWARRWWACSRRTPASAWAPSAGSCSYLQQGPAVCSGRHIACSQAAVLLQLTVTSNCRLLQLAAGWRLDIISSNSRCSYEPCRWEGRFAIFSGAQPLFGYYKVINRPGDIATAGDCPAAVIGLGLEVGPAPCSQIN